MSSDHRPASTCFAHHPPLAAVNYDRRYDFELQLFIQTFCRDIIEHSVDAADDGDFNGSHKKGHSPNEMRSADASAAGNAAAIRPPRSGDVRFIAVDAQHDDVVSSGAPSPSSAATPVLSVSPRSIRRSMTTRSPSPCENEDLWNLSAVANALTHENLSEVERSHQTVLIEQWAHVAGPFFEQPLHAKAFLREVHILAQREEAARYGFRKDVLRWWHELHAVAAPLHSWAQRLREEQLRLQHREACLRDELEDQEDVGRAVLRYVQSVAVRGAEWTKTVFLQGEDIAQAERLHRHQLQSQEIKYRAHFNAAQRLLPSLPPAKAHHVVETLFALLHPAHSAAALPRRGDSDGEDGTSLRRLSSSRIRTPLKANPEAVRITPEPLAVKSHARMISLLNQSYERASRVRATSAELDEKTVLHKAADISERRIAAAIAKETSRRRRDEQQASLEAHFAKLRQTSRVEKLAYEWLGHEKRHPEVEPLHRSLLTGSEEHRRAVSALSGVFGRSSTPGDAEFDTTRTFPPRTASAQQCRPSSRSSLLDVSYLPKHQLPPAEKKILRTHSASLRSAHPLKRPVFSSPSVSKLTIVSRQESVTALSGAIDLTTSSGSSAKRSPTPPLHPMEADLVRLCEALRALMKQSPFHYAAPAPVLYTVDGSDAIQGRNLLGDDVELHLLSPLERIMRWNVRAQQALRNEQYSVAEAHLKNAMTALHNCEKDRRRAVRRRSRQGSHDFSTPLADVDDDTPASPEAAAEPNTAAPADPADSQRASPAAASPLPARPAALQTADSLTSGFGFLSLQNVKVLTYTNRSFLHRALGRYRDALQDIQTVLRVQEAQDVDIEAYRRTLGSLTISPESTPQPTRRGVRVVSPRSIEDNQMGKHLAEHHYGVQPDILINISALLLHVDNYAESLLYGRRAVAMLQKQCEEELTTMERRSKARDPGEHAESPTSRAPDGAVIRGTQLAHRHLFAHSVAALHNIAMTQSSQRTQSATETDARRVGKASHAAALRLGRLVLGNDHALVVRVEEHSSVIAQLLAQ